MIINPLCIYHAGCCDGQGAAAAFYHKHPDAELFPGTYSRPPPSVEDRDVYLVDFSYPKAVLEIMLETAKSITIIDHHKTALEDLQDFEHPKLTKVFDLTHSGAVLTWMWCYPGHTVPELLTYIEDRDLWKFELKFTREINAYLYSKDFDVKEWTPLLDANILASVKGAILSIGRSLVRQDEQRVNLLIRNKRKLWIGGLQVWAVNCNMFHASDVGHELAQGNLFAATYYDTTDGRVFSLRANKDSTIDVAVVAQGYGGGGHPTAAGFKVTLAEAALMEVA
jgi:uncharacterized protein